MKDDTISRQDALDEIRRFSGYLDEDMINRIHIGLNRLPSAERHGRWEIADDMPRLDNTFTIRCSLCGQLMFAHPNDENPNFCCNCGARMDLEENE